MMPFLYLNSRDEPTIESDCSELINELVAVKDIDEKGNVIFRFWYRNRAKHFKSLENIINEVKEEAKIQNSMNTLGWCSFVMGGLKSDGNRFLEGIDAFQSAQDYFLQNGNKEGFVRAINGEGIALFNMGRYSESLTRYSKALDVAEELGTDNLISAISNNICQLFFSLNFKEEAIEFLNAALKREKDGTLNQALMWANLGRVHTKSKNFELAEEYLQAAIAYFRRTENKYLQTEIYYYMGLLKQAQGKKEESLQIFRKTLRLANDTNHQRYEAGALLELTILEEGWDLGIRCEKLQKVLELSRTMLIQDYEAKVLSVLADVYKDMGDFGSAFKASQTAIKIENKIFNDEMINQTGVFKVRQARKENKIYKELWQQINIIGQIGQALTSTLDSKEVAKLAYAYLADMLRSDSLFIGLFTGNERKTIQKIFIEDNKMFLPENTPITMDGLKRLNAVFGKKTLLVNDVLKDSSYVTNNLLRILPRGKNIKSFLCSSLIINDVNMGLFSVHSSEGNVYSANHVDSFTAISAYLAIALYNAKLFSDVDKLATLDPLTNILNRRSVLEYANDEFLNKHRHGMPLTIAVLDLDKFKSINDNHGHDAGDRVLKKLVEIMKETIRLNDLPGRFGGDEFLLILPQTSLDEAAIIGERLRKGFFESELISQKGVVKASISIGLTEVRAEDNDITDTINRADNALYKAKEKGGNMVWQI